MMIPWLWWNSELTKCCSVSFNILISGIASLIRFNSWRWDGWLIGGVFWIWFTVFTDVRCCIRIRFSHTRMPWLFRLFPDLLIGSSTSNCCLLPQMYDRIRIEILYKEIQKFRNSVSAGCQLLSREHLEHQRHWCLAFEKTKTASSDITTRLWSLQHS